MRPVDYIAHAGRRILDLLFPPRCVACRAFDDEREPTYLCDRCRRGIPVQRTYTCVGCGAPTPFGLTCHACRPELALDQLCAAAPYDHRPLTAALHAYKYRFIDALARPLADVIEAYIHDRTRSGLTLFATNPLVVPVPLTQRRRNWRGFNQAELLAHRIAANHQAPLATDVLARVRSAPQQARASNRVERFANVHSIFACTAPDAIRGRDVLLVDDVCTTGATLDECARTLKAAGARAVSALVIARKT